MIVAMRPLTLLLAFCLGAAIPAQERLTPELLWQLGRVSDPALAPGGKQLAYVVRTYDLAANTGRSQVFVLDMSRAGPGRQCTDQGSNDSPMWSPDGSQLAFVSTAGGAPQIYVMPATGGAPRQVTQQLGGVANARWSPDGKNFLFTSDVKLDADEHDRNPDLPKTTARAYDDLMIRHWDTWNDGTYSHLFVVPAASGAPRDLMAGDRADTPLKPFGGVEQIAWSPDGKEICYTCKRAPDPEASTDSSLFAVQIDSGATTNLTTAMPGYDQDPAYSPDGRWIAFVSMAHAGFESDRARLFLHDRRNQQNRELLHDADFSVHDLVWTADSQSVCFTVEKQGTTQIYRATLDGKWAPATSGRQELDSIQLAADGNTFYALRSTMERPFEVVRIDAGKGDVSTPLTHVNDAIYDKLALPSVKEEWFTATDGKKIQSWTVFPPDFDPHKKWPLILYCQGGPQSMIGQWFSFRWNFHLMASKGYVVAAVNRRGLPGFGQAWNDEISRDWGGQAMQDLLSVTDAMQQRPYIDKEHSAAVGASFGGYSVYWLMGNAGDRFCCMIAHCGVFNLESMYLSTEELWFPNWDLGGPYWRSPEVQKDYDRFSPHRFVQNWKTPLLVFEGEHDFRVPYDQGLQAFTAAQVRGVPSRLVEFPDECHWVLHPQNAVLWQREFFSWLDRWCKAAADARQEKK
jgi:dipeptidyl aminopeptidase/acylaminoacyl peptidase